LKALLFLACLGPALSLVWRALHGTLGANPVQTVQFQTGLWTLNLLFATLLITPVVRFTGKSQPIRYRRMIGLFAFFYATSHFLTYLVLDKFFDLHEIWKDVAKRLWITAGFSAFVLLIPLAVTSTDGMIRRLGKNWGRLHRLIYPAAILGVVHFLWLVKKDKTVPLEYASVLAALFGARLAVLLRKPA
jgi:methionine sulfoxide reductase heme-binding subunit